MRVVAELQPLGVVVAAEPHTAEEEAILSLDQFAEADAEAAAEPTTGPSIDEGMLARLATIDGDETQPQPAVRVERPAATVTAAADSPGATTPDEDARRFRPSTEYQAPMELQIDRPPPPPAPPPSEADPDLDAADARQPAAPVSHAA